MGDRTSATSRHSGRLAVATRADYYSPREVADLLGVSLRTVRSMIATGDLRAVRVGPKLVRVTASALDEAIRPYTAVRGGDAL